MGETATKFEVTTELIERFHASIEKLYVDGTMERPPYPSPVDIKIAEIFKSFACLEDCNVTTEQTQNQGTIDNFQSNPRLTAVLKK